MTELQLISQYGIVGFLGYFFIKEVFLLLKGKKNGNIESDKTESQMAVLSIMFNKHEETQKETMKTIHNTIHTQSEGIKDLRNEITNNRIAIKELSTIINERIPKKL